MGNVHTVGPDEALIVSGKFWTELLQYKSVTKLTFNKCRRMLSFNCQEDGRRRLGMGLVDGN